MLKSISRNLRLATLGAALSLTPLLPAVAQNDADAEKSEYVFSEDEDLFILGTALDVLFHEGGHLVIDVFDIPILGQEEDAADNFSTLALLSMQNEFASYALSQSIYGGLIRSALDGVPDVEVAAYFGQHDLFVQRASRKLCYLMSAEPETYGSLAKDFEFDENMSASCTYRLKRSLDDWVRVLEGLDAFGESQYEVTVEYQEAPPELEPYRKLLEDNEVLEFLGLYLANELALPRAIEIVAQVCDEPNAYYMTGQGKVVYCYNLSADFHAYYAVAEEVMKEE